jgi:hypothetical protein
MLLLRQFSKFK